MNWLSFLYLFAGAAILMIAGDALVRGAMGISLRSGWSPAFVSLTVVAFGTSLPELIVSVQAALTGSPDIALGNVVGSNIANILLIVGVPALLITIATGAPELRRNVLMMMLATVAFAAVAWTGSISRLTGSAFLIALIAIIAMSVRASSGTSAANADDGQDGADAASLPVSRLAAYIAAGVIGLPIGAYGLIEGARDIALELGMSESAVGLTVVALGTSLPELAASVAAAWRGRADMVMGNVIGSNMMNILAILGITAIISPLTIPSNMVLADITLLLAVSAVFSLIVYAKWRIGKLWGAAFLAAYRSMDSCTSPVKIARCTKSLIHADTSGSPGLHPMLC